MTANLNVSDPNKKIAANPGVSTVTGWPVGFWWAELTHPFWAFTEAGLRGRDPQPQGRRAAVADGFSDPEDASGYSAHDILSLGFKKSPKHRALVEDTKSLEDVNPGDYDASSSPAASRRCSTFRG
jgi:putative intracellular protease/amidase